MQLEAERQKAAQKEAEKMQKQQVMPAPHHIDCPLDASLPFASLVGKGGKRARTCREEARKRESEADAAGSEERMPIIHVLSVPAWLGYA
jgi:hypothetical protein